MTTGKQITAHRAHTTIDTNLPHARPVQRMRTAGMEKVILSKRSQFQALAPDAYPALQLECLLNFPEPLPRRRKPLSSKTVNPIFWPLIGFLRRWRRRLKIPL